MNESSDPQFLPALTFWATIGAFSLAVNRLMARRKRSEKQVLSDLKEDSSAIRPLLQLLGSGDGEIHSMASSQVIKLVPQLPEHILVPLSGQDRDELYRALHDPDPSLVCSILMLIEKLGDTTSLREVSELKQRHQNARVLSAAEKCIGRLNRILEEHGETLLRPSSPGVESLVRAAGTGNTTSEEELLRVAEVDPPTE